MDEVGKESPQSSSLKSRGKREDRRDWMGYVKKTFIGFASTVLGFALSFYRLDAYAVLSTGSHFELYLFAITCAETHTHSYAQRAGTPEPLATPSMAVYASLGNPAGPRSRMVTRNRPVQSRLQKNEALEKGRKFTTFAFFFDHTGQTGSDHREEKNEINRARRTEPNAGCTSFPNCH